MLRLARPGMRLFAASMVALAVACSPAAPAATSTAASTATGAGTQTAKGPVAVSLVEWAIRAEPAQVAPGTTTFNVRNNGTVPHNLLIIRSDEAPTGLPTVSGRLDEAGLQIVGRTGDLTGGSGEEITVELPAGRYILACNVIGHYNSGQAAAFTVQ
ncbi:MAG: sulfocyanin-like copper-binding protein [Dehalococcoidia bacterium]